MVTASQSFPSNSPADSVQQVLSDILHILNYDDYRPMVFRLSYDEQSHLAQRTDADGIANRLAMHGYSVQVNDNLAGHIFLVITENMQ